MKAEITCLSYSELLPQLLTNLENNSLSAANGSVLHFLRFLSQACIILCSNSSRYSTFFSLLLDEDNRFLNFSTAHLTSFTDRCYAHDYGLNIKYLPRTCSEYFLSYSLQQHHWHFQNNLFFLKICKLFKNLKLLIFLPRSLVMAWMHWFFPFSANEPPAISNIRSWFVNYSRRKYLFYGTTLMIFQIPQHKKELLLAT